MEPKTISEHSFHPGEIVEFRVTDAALSKAPDAPRHDAPASYVQEDHLRRYILTRSATQRNASWLMTVFTLPYRIDVDAMNTAVQRWVRRHSSYGCRFLEQDGTFARTVVPEQDIELAPHNLGYFDDSIVIQDFLREKFYAETDPFSWPSFSTGVILGADRSTVYFATDHTNSDGMSQTLVYNEIRALYLEETTGEPANLPATNDYLEYCVEEREYAAQFTIESEEIRRWLDFYSVPAKDFPLDLGTEPGVVYPGKVAKLELFTPSQADAFAKSCKANGAGFTTGLLAAYAMIAWEMAGIREYRGLTALHTRSDERWAETQGWFINLVPVAFDVDEDADFASLIQRAQASFDAARGLAELPLGRVGEVLSEQQVLRNSDGGSLPMTSYIDFRHGPRSKEWAEVDYKVLAAEGALNTVPIWVGREWGRTFLKALYPDTPQAAVSVPAYVDRLAELLRTVAKTGNYRPSVTFAP